MLRVNGNRILDNPPQYYQVRDVDSRRIKSASTYSQAQIIRDEWYAERGDSILDSNYLVIEEKADIDAPTEIPKHERVIECSSTPDSVCSGEMSSCRRAVAVGSTTESGQEYLCT